ncbi:MAG: hypothetical protein LBL26_00750 [Peptococcaceae bacterium]|jgi:hypothetical protein|nr:hypothetical protein [Peptococcaceae bacterium]
MNYAGADIVEDVRKNRELLLEKHGGIDGLSKYMKAQRSGLEEQGWKFVTLPHNDAWLEKISSNGEMASVESG